MKGKRVNDPPAEGNGHLTYQGIAGCFANNLAVEEQKRIQQHCVECFECREQLALVVQSLQHDDRIDQSQEFSRLLKGVEIVAESSLRQRNATETKSLKQPMNRNWITDWIPTRRQITVMAVVFIAAVSVWFFWQHNRPVERAMASLRNVWTVSRPIQARVTGDFPYLPYDSNRSANDKAPANELAADRAQLMAAEADLKREVADRGSAKSRHALARLYLLKSELDEAEEQLKQVLREEPGNAAARVDLAAIYFERGVSEQTIAPLLRAAEECKKATDIAPKLPEAWFNLALIHEQMLLMTNAQKDWEQYLQLDPSSNWAVEARARLQKLRQRSSLQDPQPQKVAEALLSAEAEHNEADIRRLLDENFTEVSELIRGRFLDNYLKATLEGNREEAKKNHQLLRRTAQLIRETKGDHYFSDLLGFVDASDHARLKKIREIRELLQQGETMHRTGQYPKAIESFSAAKSAAEKIADDCHAEAAMYGLARIYTTETETVEMAAIRERLLVAANRRHHLQMQAKSLATLANQYGAERKLSRYLETGLRAQEIAGQIRDTDALIASLKETGVAYSSLGEEEQGYKTYHLAIQTFYAHQARALRACQAYWQFATALSDYGHYQEAFDYQREALPFCQRSNLSIYLPALGRAGKYAALAGRKEESLRLLREALTEAERHNLQPLLVDMYLSLGDALLSNERFSEAESAYKKAMEKIDDKGQQEKHLRYSSAIHRGLAAALLSQGKTGEAEAALNKSIDLTELFRGNVTEAAGRSTFVGSMLNVYRSMVEFQYFHKHSPERAFDFSEIYRSRELLDLIDHSREIKWEENKNDLKVARSTEPLTMSQIQKEIPPDAQIVEYAITRDRLLIWVIGHERWATKSVESDPAQLQALVSDYLRALRERRDQSSLNVLAKNLYRILIQPVAAHLNPQGNLVIIPDGILGALPFAALVNPETQRYLLEDYTLTVDPSASILARTLAQSRARRLKPAQSLLAVSDPEFDRRLFPKLPRLPRAEEEISELSSLYPVYSQLGGAQATKQAFLRMVGNFEVVNLATHSIANTREPLHSAIVLAAGDRNQAIPADSILQAHEIFRLRLPHTRLVILSSCNSIVNQQSGHNGLGGLAHAFFSAGVPTVIGSLWEVKDDSTAILISEFHRRWRTSKLSTGEALRQAQLLLLRSANERWRHPLYWAAFLVSGDGITV